MKKTNFNLMMFIIGVFILVFPKSVVFAGENYSVRPLLTENQSKEVTDFFDVTLNPGQGQELTIEVKNKSDDELTVIPTIENTITNDNGIIDYVHGSDIKYDKTLKYKFADISSTDKKVIVPAKTTKTFVTKLTMPKEKLNGIILGGIRVIEDYGNEKDSKSSITNHYSYIIPVKLRQNDKPVANKLKFQGVKIGQHDFQNVVKAKLQNPQPEILRELTLNGEITKKGKKEVLYSEKREDSKLAPNSNFSYTIPLGKDKFKAGDYTLTLTAKAKGLKEKWTADFTITAKEAKALNDQLFTYEKKTPWWYYLIAVIVVLIVIGIIVFIVQNRKHQKKLESEIANLVAKGSKNEKKKRKKKGKGALLIPLLLVSYGSVQRVQAAEDGDGKSEAAIHIYKNKEQDKPDIPKDTPKDYSKEERKNKQNQSNVYDKKQSDIGGGKQLSKVASSLPQLSENNEDRFSKIGCIVVIGSGFTLIFLKKRKEDLIVD